MEEEFFPQRSFAPRKMFPRGSWFPAIADADEAESVSEARERRKERGQGSREGGRWRKEEKAREHRATKSERRIRAFEAVHVVALTWLISLQRR